MRRDACGVLTFHRCINYGSYWQAACLLAAIRARGCDAVIADHASRAAARAERRCALRPVLPTPAPFPDTFLYAAKTLRFRAAQAALPRSRRFALERPQEMEEFALVVVGSDEVWNLRHPWYGGQALFFGDGLRARRIVSYAASFGSYPAEDGLHPAWAERLARFDAISVRDRNSGRLVEAALGREPELVLDPCLQTPPHPEGPWKGPDGPFALVYGHNFTEGFAREARRWAGARGCRLLSIGYRNAWVDDHWIAAGPHDFAQAMARARAVVTNFFHGCIFALGNLKPFACERSDYRAVKIRDLVESLDATARLLPRDAPPEAFDAALDAPIGAETFARIEALRRASNAYLDRVLARP